MATSSRSPLGSLRMRLITGMVSVNAAIMLLFIGYLTVHQRHTLRLVQRTQVQDLSRNLAVAAVPWMASRDLAGLQELVMSLRRNPQVTYAMLLDAKGRVFAHTELGRRNQFVRDLPALGSPDRILDHGQTLDAVVPCLLGGTQLGWARVGFNQALVQDELARITRYGMLLALLATLLIGALSAWIARSLLSRLYLIRRVSSAMAGGERSLLIPELGADEIGDLGRDLNAMLASLKAGEDAVRGLNASLEIKVDERTVALAASVAQLRTLFDARLEAEQALKVNEERLRLALDASTDSIWDWDLSTGKVFRSPNWFTMFGYAQRPDGSDLLDVRALIHPDDREAVIQASQQAISHGTSYAVEARMRRADGSWHWIQSRGSVSAWDAAGRAIRLSGTNSDIHQRKQAEEENQKLAAQLHQSQKMESLGVLAGGVAHDMNNVLAAILSLASAHLTLVSKDSPSYPAFATIRDAATRGGTMVKRLLNFARQRPSERHPLDLNALLLEEAHLLERTTLAKIRLEMELAPELPRILGDASGLAHAIMNLCVNAVDAMEAGGTLLFVTRETEDGMVELRVEDSGCGMTQEVLARALDPFFTTKEVGKGTGLGLAMVYATVLAHQGRMQIQSQAGQGTQVSLRFPAADGAEQGAPSAPLPPLASPSLGLAVLLIDDDDLIQSSTGMVVELLGHSVTAALSGEAALAMIEQGYCPDIVILDMNMPGIGGKGTLPRLRRLCPGVPVLLATGRADQDALDLIAAHPLVTLLPKPFSMEELQGCLLASGAGNRSAER